MERCLIGARFNLDCNGERIDPQNSSEGSWDLFKKRLGIKEEGIWACDKHFKIATHPDCKRTSQLCRGIHKVGSRAHGNFPVDLEFYFNHVHGHGTNVRIGNKICLHCKSYFTRVQDSDDNRQDPDYVHPEDIIAGVNVANFQKLLKVNGLAEIQRGRLDKNGLALKMSEKIRELTNMALDIAKETGLPIPPPFHSEPKE